ncbi:unnamed protein product [Soboliphyme baturini]|uniref:LRRCT domain-containing protein n=1 Tax=Soboliphyme baturini TaxID=241478 RepID=A0A183J041_9BILA|nr:unnamed protein product [Soboliphyme baturini]
MTRRVVIVLCRRISVHLLWLALKMVYVSPSSSAVSGAANAVVSAGVGGGNRGGVFQVDNGCTDVLPPPCRCTKTSVECINGQFTDTDIFLQISSVHFPQLQLVIFEGNNFVNLPSHMFGPSTSHVHLRSLNLSANYFVVVSENAFHGMRALQTLDLSDNEIILRDSNKDMFKQVPHLKNLLLRKAFRYPVNVTHQMNLLKTILNNANLTDLEHLDLSWNSLDWFPEKLPCSLPRLRHLNLANNNLKTFNFAWRCLQQLTFLALADKLPSSCTISLRMNPFACDCRSATYIEWLKVTDRVRDVRFLKCYSPQPSVYLTPLVEVNTRKLVCNLSDAAAATESIVTANLPVMLAVVCFLFNP